jgi:hypothetical protein
MYWVLIIFNGPANMKRPADRGANQKAYLQLHATGMAQLLSADRVANQKALYTTGWVQLLSLLTELKQALKRTDESPTSANSSM